AIARSRPKRKINYRFGRRSARRRKSGRIEFPRLRPESVAPVEMKDRHNHIHSLRNTIAAQFVLLGAATTDRPDRRIKTERFFNHLSHIAEDAHVLYVQPSLRPTPVDFGEQLLLDLRMLRDPIEEPRHGVGSGFVPS